MDKDFGRVDFTVGESLGGEGFENAGKDFERAGSVKANSIVLGMDSTARRCVRGKIKRTKSESASFDTFIFFLSYYWRKETDREEKRREEKRSEPSWRPPKNKK
jgi:hypothetical protein